MLIFTFPHGLPQIERWDRLFGITKLLEDEVQDVDLWDQDALKDVGRKPISSLLLATQFWCRYNLGLRFVNSTFL